MLAGSLPSGKNLQPAASSSLLIFMRAAASFTISLTPLSNEEGQKHSCAFLLALFEVGRFNLPPGAVSDVEHAHRLPPFIYFINDPIDMRLIAVKQVPQIPPPPTRCTSARRHVTPQRSFPYKEFQGRGTRERQTQRGMSCLRRMSSNTSPAGRVRPWTTSSRPWRMPSAASAAAATSSRR